MHLWAHIKKKIAANPPVAVALIAVIAGVVFIPYREYKWVGHGIIGLITFALVIVTVTLGATLAGKIRRPPSRNRFHLHRKHGIAAGSLLAVALTYGLWMVIADGVRPLNSFHGLGALVVATMLGVQITTGLSSHRRLMKSVHRRVGYLVAILIILQVALGIISSPLFAASGQYPRYTVRWLTLLDET